MAVPNRQSVDEEFKNRNNKPNSSVTPKAANDNRRPPLRVVQNQNNQRKTVADDFVAQYDNPQSRFAERSNERGIQNVQVMRAAEAEEQNKIVRYENNQRQIMAEQIAIANSPTRDGRVKGSRLKAMVTDNLARVRALPVVIEIAIWYWPWYFFLELILAILGSISFGIAAWLYTVADPATIDALTRSWSGLGVTAFFFIYLGVSAFIFFFRICQILISTFQFKALFIHPWFGEGAGFKISTLMLTLIGSFIPFLQIFPVFWLWIIAVLWNPK